MAEVRTDLESRVEEKLAECVRFVGWFKQKFVPEGEIPPPFYEGLLSAASCAAWNAPALQVKMLAMYVHYDGNPAAAAFASHLLSDAARHVLADCVLWGWDATSDHNWDLIVEMIFQNFGVPIGHVFEEMCEEDFPCMILLTRGKEGIDLVGLVPCSPHKSNTILSLFQAGDLFTTKLRPSLAHKENSKKQKSQFCHGGWTKVTEAMAINANIAASRFMSTKTCNAPDDRADHSEGNELGKFPAPAHPPHWTPADKPSASDRLKIVENLVLEEVSWTRMNSLD